MIATGERREFSVSRASVSLPRILSTVLFAALAVSLVVGAQVEGGLYIAGNGFTLEQVADRGLAQNPGGQRFFVLVLPPHTAALTLTAPDKQVSVRNRILAGNGVLLVCQRDIDSGTINRANLAPGVIPVRGWPPPGSDALPEGQRYYPDENPANLPQATTALRRLRATCS
jgi:hypothetical protein